MKILNQEKIINSNKNYVLLFICLAAVIILLSCKVQDVAPPAEKSPTIESSLFNNNKDLAVKILNNPDLTLVLEKAKAYQECLPMIERVRVNNDFFEWYTIDSRTAPVSSEVPPACSVKQYRCFLTGQNSNKMISF
jgi:hypothetical protein